MATSKKKRKSPLADVPVPARLTPKERAAAKAKAERAVKLLLIPTSETKAVADALIRVSRQISEIEKRVARLELTMCYESRANALYQGVIK